MENGFRCHVRVPVNEIECKRGIDGRFTPARARGADFCSSRTAITDAHAHFLCFCSCWFLVLKRNCGELIAKQQQAAAEQLGVDEFVGRM